MSIVPPRCRFGCQIVLLCAFWYAVSSAASIVNKLTLQRYPYPMTVALASLLSIPLYARPLLRWWQINKCHISSYHMTRYIIPIAVGKAFATASAYFSLYKVPVSYAHTVKATMPLFAIVFARVVLNEKQSTRVYLSLVPIIVGVLIASLTELSFSLTGLIAALLSTSTYALLNVFVKRVLKDTNIHPITLLALNAQIAAMVFFPFWCLRDGFAIWNDITSEEALPTNVPDLWFVLCLLMSGLLSFCQNMCAFTLIHRLTALSYAVTNATKRITVISASLLMLRNPITTSNAFGMVLAIMGVFLYNRAKQQHNTKLPLAHKGTSLSTASMLSLSDSTVDMLVSPSTTNQYIYPGASGRSSNIRDTSPHRMHVRFVN